MDIVFTKSAERELGKLNKNTRIKILQKLRFYSQQTNPLDFADTITNKNIGQFRFRIGDYRVIFDIERNTIFILSVGHRKDIYRR